MCNSIILWFWLCVLSTAFGASYKSCQINIMNEKCNHNNTICVQNKENETIGFCKCIENYRFNEDFVNDDDYCLPNKLTTSIPAVEHTTSDISIVKTENLGSSNDVFLGILIVAVVVCLVSSAGFIIYRYGIWNWFRTKISERRGPPQYEDVMIGQEDTDDDPLP